MASNYWAKIYIEVLDDPKMGRLTDRLWRRTFELILQAKEYNRDGQLPSVKDMAWRLRINADELETDLADLASEGIVHKENDRWIVTNFVKRQGPVPSTERWHQWRDRQRKEEYYQTNDKHKSNATQTKRLTDTEEEEDKETEEETEGNGIDTAYAIYEKEIGIITPFISDDIEAYWNDIPPNCRGLWFTTAVNKAASNNVRNWNYIKAILDNWISSGKMTTFKQKEGAERLEGYTSA